MFLNRIFNKTKIVQISLHLTFKLIHRIVITKKELFKFGIKTDDECLYCGDKDSIEHTFIECPLAESIAKK